MKNWKIVKLGEIAEISRGGSFQKKDFCDSGVPCIHYGQIYTRYNFFTDNALTFINEEVAERQKFAVKNDIIMAVTSENIDDVCKCVAWLGEEKIAVSGHSVIIHHNQNSKYLSYYFHSGMFYNQKKKLAHGTKVIEMTPDKIQSIKVLLPPIEEQNEIADILSTQDKLIELKQKLIDQKKLQKKWLMQNLLTGKIRLDGFSDEWKKVKLSDTCKFLDNLRKPVKENERISGCYPYYGASGIIDYVDDYIFEGEYILLGEDGANIIMRSTSLAFKVKGKIWVNNHAHVLQLKSNYNIDFIVNVLESIHYGKYNSGTAQPKLYREVCENIILIVPLLAEQTAIGEILSAQDKEIELLEKELEQEKLKKKSLMQFLLSDV